MKFSTEVEINETDFSDNDLCKILDDRLCYAGCLLTEEAKKVLSPRTEVMGSKLEEVRLFLAHPSEHLKKEDGKLVLAYPFKPKVVCFCGSTRFAKHFMVERWRLEKEGIITLGINILPDGYFEGDNHHGAEQEGVKHILDELHKRKIDLADEVFILNVGGYIGESTRAEVNYAIEKDSPVRYLEPIAEGK